LNYKLLVPEVFLFLWAIFVFVLDFFLRKENKHNLGYICVLGIGITLGLTFITEKGNLFGQMFLADDFSFFFKLIFLVSAFLAILSSVDFIKRIEKYRGEYFGLILLSTVGMMFLASAGELLSLYVALELTTIPLFVLAAYLKDNYKSSEAGLKYMILGAISSAILLYGISLIYGISGTTDLQAIKSNLIHSFMDFGKEGPALFLGLIFMIAGFGFKLALVPFHMWAPDVYQGAPTPITAYLSVASKAAGLAAFVRIFIQTFVIYQYDWVIIVYVLAVLGMVLGNIIALLQTDIKRMLAYSSIAQVGYILIGMIATSQRGVSALAFYAFAYLFANMGAFIVAIAFSNSTGSDEIKDYADLSRRSPFLAILMTIFLLSLVGIPPLAGFVGKYFLFASAIEQGYVGIVVIAVLTSVISLYYYVGVVREMYFHKKEIKNQAKIVVPLGLKLALLISFLGVIILGLYPNPILKAATLAAMVFRF
jgi:NADH-quinone oxidoreductase subunit N